MKEEVKVDKRGLFANYIKKPDLRKMYKSTRDPVGEVSGQTFVPVLWMKGLENLSLNGLEQKHHLQLPDSVFWLHQVAANTKMYG